MARMAGAPSGATSIAGDKGFPGRPAAGASHPTDYLSARARLGAALLGIAIGLLVAAACAALGILLGQAIFGTTTGGIL